MSEQIVIVDDLGKRYPIGDGKTQFSLMGRLRRQISHLLDGQGMTEEIEAHHWALRNVSFTVNRGERVGVIGRNGAGKSTLLKIMSRVSYPTEGEIRIQGSLASLLEVGTGFNDNLTGRDNVYLNASLYGMTRQQVETRFDDIVRFSEIGRFIDTPVKNYSSGMKMRLAFAVAAYLESDILLLDEVLAVGDMAFQRKCLERVDDLTSGGRTLFFVSHSMDAVSRYCDRCIWIDAGTIRMDGDVQEAISTYVETVMSVRSSISSSDLELKKTTSGPEGVSNAYHKKGILHSEKSEPGKNVGDGSFVSNEPRLEVSDNVQEHEDKDEVSAELVSAHIVDADKKTRTLFGVDESVCIEMIYRISGPGMFVPGIHVYCPQGSMIFVSAPPEKDLETFRYSKTCTVTARVQLPCDVLNIGTYSVSLVLFDPSMAPMKRYFQYEQVLSFHSIEAPDGVRSARGIMPRDFAGPIRPLLDWTLLESS